MIEVYESAVDATGRLGAVFEREDDTAYFYLLDMRRPDGSQIVSAFNADAVNEMAVDVPISIRWNATTTVVGLFVDGGLFAVFDLQSDDLKGRYAVRADDLRFLTS